MTEATIGRPAGQEKKTTLNFTFNFDFRKVHRQLTEAGHAFRIFGERCSRRGTLRSVEALRLELARERQATVDPYLHVWTQTVQTPTGTVCKVVTKRLGCWGDPRA